MLRARLALAALAAATVACGGGGGGGKTATPTAGPVTTAVGTALEPGAFATVHASGGSFSSSDGRLVVTFPAGAVDADTAVTIQRITNTAPGGNGVAYRLLPSRTFAQPVTLAFDASGVGSADAGGMGVAYQTPARQWSWISDGLVRDTGANRVSVTTTHFTDFSLVSSILLQPLSATVATGGSVALEVAACFEPDEDGSLASLLAWDCSTSLAPLGVTLDAGSWSVNGVPGGNSTYGTIVPGSGLSATYRAPSAVPSPSTVAVTVKTQAMAGRPQATLYSLVDVTGGATLRGTFTATGTFYGSNFPMTLSISDAVLTLHDDGIDETNFDLTGTLHIASPTLTDGVTTCTLASQDVALDESYGVKVLKDPARARIGFLTEFPATCSPAVQDSVMVGWFTSGCPGSLAGDVAIPDTQHVTASGVARTCMSIWSSTADFSFTP